MTIKEDAQLPSPGQRVELFVIDATSLGGDVYYYTSHTDDGQPITFDGHEYTPIQISAQGWEVVGNGNLPTPTIQISNVLGAGAALVRQYADLQGATVKRYVTFAKYLDGKPDADPNAVFPPDVYTIDRKSQQNKVLIEFELKAKLDMIGMMLPRRVCLRDACTHRYRVLKSDGTFDYTNADCPYTGTQYFDARGNATDPANDQCGKKVSDCKKRFGATNELPGWFFPGMSKANA